jgi:GTP-binding protein Era
MENDFRCGFVAILGRPNVGKSTLLNALVGGKISIISSIPQTTRHQIRGILNLENAQIIFVDTPGIHSFKDTLASHLNIVAKKSIQGCDLLLYVVDISRSIGREEETIMDLLASQKIKVIMVLNKIDLGTNFINDYINLWKEKTKDKVDPLIYYLPTSAKTGKNIDKLKEVIVENLPQQSPFYDKDTLTDFPLKFRISDIIREKLFLNLKKELPHSLAVEVEEIQEKENIFYIRINIYVNRVSQKKIVIGEEGQLLKNIGKEARIEIEEILKKKVYLDIWVKVLEDWQKKSRILKELGYWWT